MYAVFKRDGTELTIKCEEISSDLKELKNLCRMNFIIERIT